MAEWIPGQLMRNREGYLVRQHIPHPRTDASERFAAMLKEIDNGQGQTCLVFIGGNTFRVDDDTVTTPRRFAYQLVSGRSFPENRRIRMRCKTPKCCRYTHMHAGYV